jgi:molybdopterin molybdotransferase
MSPLSVGVATFFMLSVSEARERILATIFPVDTQTVPIDHAATRILAEQIVATIDLPLFNNSAVDGFALHKADLASPRTLKVVADIRAGETSEVQIQPGQAVRVMTGAPLPPGANAVVMLEDTDFELRTPSASIPEMVTIKKTVQAGSNIRTRGQDLHIGDKVISVGTRLRAQEIGLLAMLGVSNVPVYRQPRLALLSSGDELLPVEASLTPGKIHESNSLTLAALAKPEGVEVLDLGVAKDTKEDIRSRLDLAAKEKADVIISSAGVSVGAFDFVKSVIEEEGKLEFWKVNMRPGKPLAFGNYRGIPYFGLPGNPVSAFVGFEVFVRPALEKLSGREVKPHPHQTAFLAEPLESDGRESYLRAIVAPENGRLTAHLTGHQGSGNIFSLVLANALLIVPSGVKSLLANSEVEIWPIQ